MDVLFFHVYSTCLPSLPVFYYTIICHIVYNYVLEWMFLSCLFEMFAHSLTYSITTLFDIIVSNYWLEWMFVLFTLNVYPLRQFAIAAILQANLCLGAPPPSAYYVLIISCYAVRYYLLEWVLFSSCIAPVYLLSCINYQKVVC